MTNILVVLQREKKYIFLLGDYNVDISPAVEINLATEELKIFYHMSVSFFSLISTRMRANILSPLLTTFIATFLFLIINILAPNVISAGKKKYTISDIPD